MTNTMNKIVRRDRTVGQNINRALVFALLRIKQNEQHSFNTKFNQFIDKVRGYEYEETEDYYENYTDEDVEDEVTGKVIQFPISRVSNL